MIRLGQRLKDARIQRKLTIEEVATATKIKPQFLSAIERDAYGELPSPAYAQGFARNYADFLGLPKAQSQALFKRDFDEKKAMKVLPDGMTKTQSFPLRRLNIKRVLIGASGLILFLGFLLFQYRSMFFAPQLSLLSPKEGSQVLQELEVSGKTDSTATLTINNQSVFVNTKGEFEKKISLFPGKNTITVKSINRFGKETVTKRDVIVK